MPLFAQLFSIRMQLVDTRQRMFFCDDAETNARQLLRLVGIVVNGLNQPRVLLPLLETLGRQHAWRINRTRQNCVVIRALFWALKATLGPVFNGTARKAWIAGFRTVAKAMAIGMAGVASGGQEQARAATIIAGNQAAPSTYPANAAALAAMPLQHREAFA